MSISPGTPKASYHQRGSTSLQVVAIPRTRGEIDLHHHGHLVLLMVFRLNGWIRMMVEWSHQWLRHLHQPLLAVDGSGGYTCELLLLFLHLQDIIIFRAIIKGGDHSSVVGDMGVKVLLTLWG